jgi:hypothetical protein
VPELIRDWTLGECAAPGRSRASLLAVLGRILALGGGPPGQVKLAREAGPANNRGSGQRADPDAWILPAAAW